MMFNLRALFHKNRAEREMDDELRFHLEKMIEQNVSRGMSAEEARYAALRQFGNVGCMKEECRDRWSIRFLDELFQDLRYGLRQLRRNAGFTVVAVLTLALGIGASTVIFGLFDAVFLRPLPVRHPERLVRVVQHVPKHGSSSLFYLDYIRALRNRAKSFEFVFGQAGKYSHFVMSDPGPAANVTLRAVTPEFFQALGTPALYGRVLMPADATEESGTPPAVLSYKFWKQRFTGDPSVAKGREIIVNGEHFAVVGVMPGGFGGLSLDTAPDLWIPLRAYPALWGGNAGTLGNPAFVGLNLAARLKSGAKVASAQAECRAIWKPVMRDFYTRNLPKLPAQVVTQLIRPKVWLEPLAHGVSVLRLRYGSVIKLLVASVGLLFLIVCANIAGLILARNTARQHEIAVRLAIGATRWRIARQVLAESVLLAATGAAGGLLIARAAMPLILTQIPPIRGVTGWPVSITLNTPINMTVFLFLLVLAIVATLVFSLAPALANMTTPLDRVLRASRSSTRLPGRQTLVAAQMALCVILLTAAGLLVRTFDDLAHTNPGFNASQVAVFTEDLTGQHVPPELLKTVRERLGEIPGVDSVAAAHFGVMRGHGMEGAYVPAGQQVTSTDWLNTDINVVSPEYFRTMGMQILTGRDFVPGDEQLQRTSGPEKAIVNKAFVHEYFPNADPIGKLIGQGVLGEVAHGSDQIIGVVNDAKDRSLREAMRPEVYEPLTRSILTHATFVLYVRTQMPAEAMIMPIRKALASIDTPLSVGLADTLREEVHNSISGDRETAVLASLFGLAAALLVCLGIYGLLAYSVTQRQQEIGIRMALGAEKRDVLRMVIGRGLRLALIGVMIGIAGALALTRFLSSLLFGVKPTDPLTFAAVSLILIAVALLACYIPARRAAKVDPMVALRYE